jgi:tRNA(Ile2)-agmatinylcytidine synthase
MRNERSMEKMHIGFDDTDSTEKGCTTYIAALIIENLQKLPINFFDYPNLIRLNPNVPWKTRGNGALCLRVLIEDNLVEEVKQIVVQTIEKNSDLANKGTDPGIVFLHGEIPDYLETFAQKTVQNLVKKFDALNLIERLGAEYVFFKKGRGIIGALAAIGSYLKEDHTYELITYRIPEKRGTLRKICASSVFNMDAKMNNLTFNNVDKTTNRILITPRGPDPILYGIRGETPEAVWEAHKLVKLKESIERWIIFKTNQGTDAHLKKTVYIKEVKPFQSVIVQGIVANKPRIIRGGHIIFEIQDKTGKIDCAVYKPTGLCNIMKKLFLGDFIEVSGGIRIISEKPITINLEKIIVKKLVSDIILKNPFCPLCESKMKSMGKGKGFECKKCGFHGPKMKKKLLINERSIETGMYITAPRSQRHLTKPFVRYGLEKKKALNENKKIISPRRFSSY